MPGFDATCGLRLGGQGEFSDFRPPGCNLIVCDGGLIGSLDRLKTGWELVLRAGLFQNDYQPLQEDTLGDYVPADFSGYGGLQFTYSWDAAVIAGPRAITASGAITWIHDGGPIQNYIFGYYVVDALGALVWAERFCPAPRPMNGVGMRIRIRPQFTLRNEFPKH